jgi:hypothetical protein
MHPPVDVAQDDLMFWARSKLRWVHCKLAIKRELEARVWTPEM